MANGAIALRYASVSVGAELFLTVVFDFLLCLRRERKGKVYTISVHLLMSKICLNSDISRHILVHRSIKIRRIIGHLLMEPFFGQLAPVIWSRDLTSRWDPVLIV
jgi:hypothetical protein